MAETEAAADEPQVGINSDEVFAVMGELYFRCKQLEATTKQLAAALEASVDAGLIRVVDEAPEAPPPPA